MICMTAKIITKSQSTRTFTDATEAFREMQSRIQTAAARARFEAPHIDTAGVESDVALAIFEMELAGKVITEAAVEILIKDAIFTQRGDVQGPSRSARAKVTAAERTAREALGREVTDAEVVAFGTEISEAAVRAVRNRTESLDAEGATQLSVRSAEDAVLAAMHADDHRAVIYDVEAVRADVVRLIAARERDGSDGGVDVESRALLLELLDLETTTKDLSTSASQREIDRHTVRRFSNAELAHLLGCTELALKGRIRRLREFLRDAHRDCCGA